MKHAFKILVKKDVSITGTVRLIPILFVLLIPSWFCQST